MERFNEGLRRVLAAPRTPRTKTDRQEPYQAPPPRGPIRPLTLFTRAWMFTDFSVR
jgi:hypothetical protein